MFYISLLKTDLLFLIWVFPEVLSLLLYLFLLQSELFPGRKIIQNIWIAKCFRCISFLFHRWIVNIVISFKIIHVHASFRRSLFSIFLLKGTNFFLKKKGHKLFCSSLIPVCNGLIWINFYCQCEENTWLLMSFNFQKAENYLPSF